MINRCIQRIILSGVDISILIPKNIVLYIYSAIGSLFSISYYNDMVG